MRERLVRIIAILVVLVASIPVMTTQLPTADAKGPITMLYDKDLSSSINRVEAISAVNDYLVYGLRTKIQAMSVLNAYLLGTTIIYPVSSLAVASRTVTKVILEELRCVETEDITGADECRLEILVDGALEATQRNSLNNDEKWALNQSYFCKNHVQVKLWDEDLGNFLDPDDFLGAVLIDTSAVSHATAIFTGYGAYYQIQYSVVKEVLSAGEQPVAANAHRVVLDKLTCKTTEDVDEDECRLEIFVDDVLTTTLTRELSKDEEWNLNQSYVFESQVKVRLYDDDLGNFLDPDDFLGDVLIYPSAVSHATATFNMDEADYELVYRVLDESAPIDETAESAAQLSLQKLHCNVNEDWFGVDECRLEVYVDDSNRETLYKDLDEGQEWLLNRSYLFKSSVRVRLYDIDTPPVDPDDFLGEVVILPNPIAQAKGYFTLDEADYELTYTVAEYTLDPIQIALDAFRNSPRSGVWPHINKADLLNDMERKIANPARVNQLNTPLCGPAAIVYELLSRQPARYVQICQELYENGSFQALTEEIEACEDTRNSEPPISDADWMLMATLRDHANLFFDVETSIVEWGRKIEGMTTPWEMEDWTSWILGYYPEYTSTYVYGELDALRDAEEALARGGVAFLMIGEDLLYDDPLRDGDHFIEHPNSWSPEHWVSLLGDVSIEGGTVKFRVYTWGGERSITRDIGDFENCMWGVVTGVPF